MESTTLCLRYNSQPTLLLKVPSTITLQPRATKLFASGRSTKSLSLIATGSLLRAIVKPTNCGSDKPPTTEKKEKGNDDNKKVVKGVALRACVAFGCALGVMSWSWNIKGNNKAIALGPIEMQSKAPPSTSVYRFGASKALQSFLDVSIKLTSIQSTPSYNQFFNLPTSVADVDEIKAVAAQQIRVGKADEAVEWLQNVREGLEADAEMEIAYHVDMVLVEILIYLVSNTMDY